MSVHPTKTLCYTSTHNSLFPLPEEDVIQHFFTGTFFCHLGQNMSVMGSQLEIDMDPEGEAAVVPKHQGMTGTGCFHLHDHTIAEDMTERKELQIERKMLFIGFSKVEQAAENRFWGFCSLNSFQHQTGKGPFTSASCPRRPCCSSRWKPRPGRRHRVRAVRSLRHQEREAWQPPWPRPSSRPL